VEPRLDINIEPFKPHGFTIFCEDLREEVTGQTTYVGVYGDAMFVDAPLPITLTQLCMAIHLFDEPKDVPTDLTIKIAQPGEDFESAWSFDVAADLSLLDLPDIGDLPARPRAHVVIKVGGSAPPPITQYGRIRIAAIWDGKFVPLGSLAIAPLSKDAK
jgi:hypothetical protein